MSIFNPEHDIVLALDAGAGFTPPKAARRLRQDLSHLPSLWGASEEPSVWGWDAAVVAELLKRGVPRDRMPSDEQLREIRRLSNRSLAVEMLSRLRTLSGTIGTSAVCHTRDDVEQFAREHGATIIKAPWSSSGRGVKPFTVHSAQFIDSTIAKQGSIIAEAECQRVMDFALEYEATPEGRVEYRGLSLFTTVNGAYKGNLLLPEEEKLAILAEHVDIELLRQVSLLIKQFLAPRLKGIYSGPLGVDMMVCQPLEPASTSERLNSLLRACSPEHLLERKNQREARLELLNPCIEINLRRTMGHVALALTAQGNRGTMSVLYNKERDKYELTVHS